MDNASPPPDDSVPDAGAHLWIPEPETRDTTSDPGPSSSRAPQLLKERLYVGNLSSTVDEYALLQVFTKFGKIEKMDFLFHKSGVHKGKPRGYAFVEYMNEADAAKALQAANGKLLRGRKLVVTFAQQAPNHNSGSTSYTGRSKRTDITPTALSLAKSSGIARPEAKTSSKIAMIEAKLRQMANSSSFADKPALPSKPVGLQRSSQGSSAQFQRSRNRGPRLALARPERTKNDTETSYGRSTPPSIRDAESSDMARIPHSSKQRSIPGVKIVKGGSNKGDSGITPST
ncbi:hypothetical protein JVU11DRAFT_8433 [Chiua virens]|nr:hypothetical protein JVU11DRAFT_8433 [Chiua virens]